MSASRRAKVREHSDGVEATDLRTYRNRHAQYQTDPDLRALHAAAPCLAIWDDHEVQNDYADDRSQNFDDPLVFLKRRAAAYQAFWEHMPLPRWARPRGPDMTIFCRHDFGALATFLLVDGRQYRSRLACDRPPSGGGKQLTDAACPERLDPRRSYLGKAQEAWLYREFGDSAGALELPRQGQLMAEFKERLDDGEISHWSEDWNGYPAARQRLLEQIAETRLANPVVLGGDIHSFWANDLKLDFDDPAAPVIASEFVGTSVTSNGPPYEKFRRLGRRQPCSALLRQPQARLCQRRIAPGAAGGRVPRRRRCARPADRRFDIAALCRRERTAGTATRLNGATYSAVADLARRGAR